MEDKILVEMLSAAIDVIVPFQSGGANYEIGEVWLAADARRRGESIATLLADS
jgi:type IV secretion system protein VirB11